MNPKNLKRGLVASYNLGPGNGEDLFWFLCFINLSLTSLDTYRQPWDPHWACHGQPTCIGKHTDNSRVALFTHSCHRALFCTTLYLLTERDFGSYTTRNTDVRGKNHSLRSICSVTCTVYKQLSHKCAHTHTHTHLLAAGAV